VKKTYKVLISIPSYTLKTIYVDDATSKTDARKKARKEMFGATHYYDMSGDTELGQHWEDAKVLAVEGGK
tara:strand:+ start:1994 stop:2203 length:210 start_codon:yes stop_codon:yes gene_type:complete